MITETFRRLVAGLLLAAGTAAACAGPAAGATLVGTAPPPAPTGEALVCSGQQCAATLTSGVRVPVSGVITSWRTVLSASANATLVRMRGTDIEGAASADDLFFNRPAPGELGAGLVDQRVRLRVLEGDRLSVRWSGTFTGTVPVPAGETFFFREVFGGSSTTEATSMPVVQATIEPDADGDGWGDETQDECPSAQHGACPTISVAEEPAPPLMPGDTVDRTFRLTNTGPGLVRSGAWVAVGGPQGATATVDGAACARRPGRSSLACEVGAIPIGRTLTVAVRATDVRAPASITLALGRNNSSFWPGPTAQRFPLAIPTLGNLRPAVRAASRLRAGRLATTASCPAAGTQDCRIRVTARRIAGGPVLARATVRIPRGAARTSRLRMPASYRAQLRKRPVPTRVTITRTDLSVSDLLAGVTVRVRR